MSLLHSQPLGPDQPGPRWTFEGSFSHPISEVFHGTRYTKQLEAEFSGWSYDFWNGPFSVLSELSSALVPFLLVRRPPPNNLLCSTFMLPFQGQPVQPKVGVAEGRKGVVLLYPPSLFLRGGLGGPLATVNPTKGFRFSFQLRVTEGGSVGGWGRGWGLGATEFPESSIQSFDSEVRIRVSGRKPSQLILGLELHGFMNP